MNAYLKKKKFAYLWPPPRLKILRSSLTTPVTIRKEVVSSSKGVGHSWVPSTDEIHTSSLCLHFRSAWSLSLSLSLSLIKAIATKAAVATCRANEIEEDRKREIEDLKAKVTFLRFWSPFDP